MKLIELGWSDYFAALFEPHKRAGLSAARVTTQHRDRCLVSGEEGDLLAEVSGRFRHEAPDRSAYPTVGDWVALEPFGRRRGLVHAVLGEERLPTAPVREGDSRGRHTTSRRELVVLPGGALLIDTPGMRELQLWAEDGSLARSFDDVEALAARCRFADCRHEGEPGCAVRKAVSNGRLDAGRLESYLKQRKELRHLALKRDVRARRQAEKEFGKMIASVKKDLKLRKPSYR